MITIARSILKRFRTLCRRGGLHKFRTSGGYVVTLIGGPDGYRIQATSPDVAIEYRHSEPCEAETIRLPLDALEVCEGRDDSPVTIEARSDKHACLSWVDRGVPRQHEVDQPQPGTVPFPTLPAKFASNDSGLWTELREAVATTDPQSSRYALGCLHLRGKYGRIEATDGRQVLVYSDVRFGFEDDLLVPGSKLLGCSDLDLGQEVKVGRAGEWLGLDLGAWTILLHLQKEGRFPKIDDILPKPAAAKSTLELTSGDARFLADTLPRLPCNDEQYRPITLDLNGQVLVRSRESEQGRPTEVQLASSKLHGEAVMLNTNRYYVERALKLGFERMSIFGPESPVLCADDRRRYLWAVLGKDSAIKRTEDPVRIISHDDARRPAKPIKSAPAHDHSAATLEDPMTVSRGDRRIAASAAASSTTAAATHDSHTANRVCTVPTASTIEQAVRLRDSLRRVAQQAGELARCLKQQRRQTRIVESTLDSLRLLQKAAG